MYYCGFTKLDNPEIQQFITSYHSSMSGLKEFVPILHCFFEAKQPSLTQLVDPNKFMSDRIPAKSLIPVDFLAVGYFIVSFLYTSTANTPILYLTMDNPIEDRCLRLLLNELSKNPFGGEVPTSTGYFSEKLVLWLYKPSITGLKYIASYLKSCSLISELTLQNINNLSALQDFIAEMLHSKIVSKVSVNGSVRSYSIAMIEIKYVYYKPLRIKQLDLSSLSEVDVCSIITHLQDYTTTLVNLNLHDTDITADTAQSLVEILQENRSLTHLNLANLKNFFVFGAYCVFKGLQHNTTLVKLDLTNCDITVTNLDTARLLSTMLQKNNSLTHLNLSGNYKFSDLGAQCIFESLQYNSTLVYLNLGMTTLTATDPDTARSLTEMLQVNKSLTHLDLSCNKDENRIISLIFSALEHNTTLLHLVLRGRDISEDDAKLIAKTLKSNQSLLTIDISHANINRIDIILSALKFKNTTLKKLCITYNRAADVAVGDLQKARKEKGLPPIDI